MRIITFILDWITLPLWPFFYLLCRLEAKPCPHCGEKWDTELIGEWGEEDWHCRRCDTCWHIPYGG